MGKRHYVVGNVEISGYFKVKKEENEYIIKPKDFLEMTVVIDGPSGKTKKYDSRPIVEIEGGVSCVYVIRYESKGYTPVDLKVRGTDIFYYEYRKASNSKNNIGMNIEFYGWRIWGEYGISCLNSDKYSLKGDHIISRNFIVNGGKLKIYGYEINNKSESLEVKSNITVKNSGHMKIFAKEIVPYRSSFDINVHNNGELYISAYNLKNVDNIINIDGRIDIGVEKMYANILENYGYTDIFAKYYVNFDKIISKNYDFNKKETRVSFFDYLMQLFFSSLYGRKKISSTNTPTSTSTSTSTSEVNIESDRFSIDTIISSNNGVIKLSGSSFYGMNVVCDNGGKINLKLDSLEANLISAKEKSSQDIEVSNINVGEIEAFKSYINIIGNYIDVLDGLTSNESKIMISGDYVKIDDISVLNNGYVSICAKEAKLPKNPNVESGNIEIK